MINDCWIGKIWFRTRPRQALLTERDRQRERKIDRERERSIEREKEREREREKEREIER